MHNVVWGCAEILPIVVITCPRGEKKFGVSKKPCNILFIISTPTKYQSFHFSIFFYSKTWKGAVFICNHCNSDLFTYEGIMFLHVSSLGISLVFI